MVQRRPSTATGPRTDDAFGSSTTAPAPWERAHPPVPYMAASSPPLSQEEREALPALWAARSHEQNQTERVTNSPRMSSHSSPASVRGSYSSTWSPPLRPSHHTSWCSMCGSPNRLPVTTSNASANTPKRLNSINASVGVNTFPGTMSSSNVDKATSHRNRRDLRRGEEPTEGNKLQRVPLARRLRATINDIFKRTPIDESMLEKVENRHWAEEESPI